MGTKHSLNHKQRPDHPSNKAAMRNKINGEQLFPFFERIREAHPDPGQLHFVCIGTDRSTGDALGPLAGTFLCEAGFPHVMGTLSQPLDATNLAERLTRIEPDRVVIAIDACLGQSGSVGLYVAAKQPLYPGQSVGLKLPAVGSYSIAAIVNADGARKYSILQTTPLSRVMRMAGEIACAAQRVFVPVMTEGAP